MKENFFEYLDFALQFAPAGPEEGEIRAKLARIGIGAGKTFPFKDLSLEHKAEVGLGMEEGEKKVEERVASAGKEIHGWRVASAFGNREFYHGNWLIRAAAAKAGIYGNDAVEAMYPMTRSDVTGAPLDGSQHKYTLTFPAGQFPPVNAFWSVTMYDGKTQLLIENPINRYLINSPMFAGAEKERGRLADALSPEGFAGTGQGVELAASPQRSHLSGDASLLAENRGPVDLAARRGDLESAGHRPCGLSNSTVLKECRG